MRRARVSARDAEHTVLHQVIALRLDAFLDAVAEAGDGAGRCSPSSASSGSKLRGLSLSGSRMAVRA
jgi:hypothetical protein